MDAAAVRWMRDHGPGTVYFLTLTMPHDYGEKLRRLLRTIRASFGALVSGRAWQTDKYDFGLNYYIVSHDATLGAAGWHPHLHILIFGTVALDEPRLTALADRLHARWERAVTSRGHRAPTREHGIRLEAARSRADLSRYVCQVVAGGDDETKPTTVAMEMARGDLKTSRNAGHRTPFQLLADIAAQRARNGEWTEDDDRAYRIDLVHWREWERFTKGVRAIRWAKGLRAAVELEPAKTDDEIVAQEIGGELVYRFPLGPSWRAVAETLGGRGRVLRAAERGGAVAVRVMVTRIYRHWCARRSRLGVRDSYADLPNRSGPDG